MTFKRWCLTGLPLTVIGAGNLWLGFASMGKASGTALIFTIGAIYLVIGLLAAADKIWTNITAQFAWYPVLLAFPLGTILSYYALKSLGRRIDQLVDDHKKSKSLDSISHNVEEVGKP